ncbi:MAG: hypothetical protein E7Z91_04850 [Cyanobacteria bacterium SIG30]|nr:hypothetical protein [Cyanobacteria bacterium SIG30]
MRRLRIVEQFMIVLFFAVVIPSIASGIIISNVSQHSVRRELNYSALLLSEYLGQNIETYLLDNNKKLSQISSTLKYLNHHEREDYLKEITHKYNDFESIKIIGKEKALGEYTFEPENSTIKIYVPFSSDSVLAGTIELSSINGILTESIKKEKRQIYLLDSDNSLIATNNQDKKDLKYIVSKLPDLKSENQAQLFGEIKNQPMAYYKIKNPGWSIIVNTTEQITKTTINAARLRIILAISISGLCIMIVVFIYNFYLYVNMRQLIKGVTAISKGSYDRKIHLLKNIFTPHEITFFAKEFNYMAKKIAQSYKELSKKNLELQRLDGFRTNLVSATSHEFRTPLTNIVGYSSRLLRQDIVIDENTKIKSLKIIKEQAQRLSRMVEDLLVIPEIESFRLQFNLDFEDLGKMLEDAVFQTNFKENNIQIEVDENIAPVYVDKDRMMQVLINLCENAIKYNKDNSPIIIKAKKINGKNVVTFFNSHDKIESNNLNKLFDKFVRVDSELTRTTRGTGLGLYIVKGISNAMGIDVQLSSTDEGFTVTLTFNDTNNNE